MKPLAYVCVALALVCLDNLGWARSEVRSTYTFSLSTYGKAQIVELKQPPSEYRSSLTGDLILVGDLRGRTLYGTLSIKSISLDQGSERMSSEEAALRAALLKPFLVYRQNGKVTGCAFSADVPNEGRKIVRTILSIAQMPGAGRLAHGKLVLDDTMGTKALGVARSKTGELLLTETKYVANTSGAVRLALSGAWSAKLASNNVLDMDEIHGQESLDALVTKQSHSTTRLRAEVRHRSSVRVPPTSLAISIGTPPQPLWTRPSEAEVRTSLAAHTLHGLGSAEVFRIVEQLGTKEQSDQSGTDAFSKLRALVIVSDAAAQEVGRRLKVSPVETSQFVVYGQALISAGTPSAQKAFLEALEARKGQQVAAQKLVAELIGLEHPAPETIWKLRLFAADKSTSLISSSAVLILGRFAGRLARSSPSEANSLIRGMGVDLIATKDPDRQRLYLGALGNAGQASCLPYVQRFVGSPNVKVRADAISALRFIPSDAVDDLICDHLMHDKSDEVREASVFALGFRTNKDENFGALVLALRSDPSERVRRSALNALWAQRDSQPAIVTIVDQVSRTDPSKEIQKTASDLLNADRGKG